MRRKISNIGEEGRVRVINKFLFFPKRIGNEVRWLEKSSIKQKLHYVFDVTSGSIWWEWRDVEWVN